MNIEIISTGNELLTGAIVDTNAAHIATTLTALGLTITHIQTIPDDLQQLSAALQSVGKRADVAIVTGGLGPTIDDITAEAAAHAAKEKLTYHQKALDSIVRYFKKRKRPMPPANKKQALLPENATLLPNIRGSAPGFLQTIGHCRFYFLPGVPSEMQHMLAKHIVPRLKTTNTHILCVKTLSSFGLSEAVVNEYIQDIARLYPQITVGTKATFPVVDIKLYASGKNKNALKKILTQASHLIAKRMHPHVFSLSGKSMEYTVGKLLHRKKCSLAVAESCTGGLISHLLTNISGASDYFHFSAVTYANSSKEDILNIPKSLITQHGAVSEAVAQRMAEQARKKAGTTYGLATSGIAGPGGGTPQKPVGTVCIGIADQYGSKAYTFHFPYGEREQKKHIFAIAALELLRRKLLDIPTTSLF